MKSLFIELIVALAVVLLLEALDWHTAALIMSCVFIICFSYANYISSKRSIIQMVEHHSYARTYHVTKMLLGDIERRVNDGAPIDVKELIGFVNDKARLTKKLDALDCLRFSDDTGMPYWEPSDAERAEQILALLSKASILAWGLPDDEKYREQIIRLRFALREQFKEDNL
ncbi:hypothetical protein V5887_000361 [Klebsiella aerogenes]